MSIGLLLATVGGAFVMTQMAGRRQGAAFASKMAKNTAATSGFNGAAMENMTPAMRQHMPYLAHEHAFLQTMSRHEALLVLGFDPAVTADPPKQDVDRRFRKMMALHHTDVGGSPLISRKVIEAKKALTSSG
jgi:hypothetical protein